MFPRLALSLALLLPGSALAAAGFVPVQGSLSDSSGVAIDGQVDVQFTLYTDSSTSTSVWTDTLTLDVVDGRFAAELGSGTPLDLDVFKNYAGIHLVIQVAGDSAMAPVPLDHVPYAAWAEHAGDAQSLGGQTLGGIEAQIPLTSDIESAARSVAFDTEAELTTLLDDNYLSAGENLDWNDLINVPAGFADGVDNDTQLDQATVEGYAEGVAYNTEAELTAVLDDNYLSVGEDLDWNDLINVPGGFADGVDNDTQLSQAQVETWAKDAVSADGIPLANGGNMTFQVSSVTHGYVSGTEEYFTFTDYLGNTYRLDVAGVTDGQTVYDPDNHIRFTQAAAGGESLIAFRLTGSHYACWLAHHDDDHPTSDRGLMFATEADGDGTYFGTSARVAMFMRDGVAGRNPIDRYATYKLVCIP